MFRSVLSKLISLFCILVFITFLVNHGHIDFSAIDWAKDKAVEVVTTY